MKELLHVIPLSLFKLTDSSDRMCKKWRSLWFTWTGCRAEWPVNHAGKCCFESVAPFLGELPVMIHWFSITKIGVRLNISFIHVYIHLYHFYSLSSALFKIFSLNLAPPMFSHCDLPSAFIIFTFISLYFISFTFIYFGFIHISYSFIFITVPLSTHCYLYLAFFNFLGRVVRSWVKITLG